VHADFTQALAMNPLLVLALPPVLLLALLVGYGVARNLPWFPFVLLIPG